MENWKLLQKMGNRKWKRKTLVESIKWGTIAKYLSRSKRVKEKMLNSIGNLKAEQNKGANKKNWIEKGIKIICNDFRGFEQGKCRRNVFNEDGKMWFHTNDSVYVFSFIFVYVSHSLSWGTWQKIEGGNSPPKRSN